jgi:hypothetical protein
MFPFQMVRTVKIIEKYETTRTNIKNPINDGVYY